MEKLGLSIFASRLQRGEECVIYGDGKQTRDFVFVADIVDAFIRASEKGESETINIGTGIETSILELYDLLCEISGVDRPPRHEPERAGDFRRSALNPTKAKQVLGWEPSTSLEEGMAQGKTC
jgi:UDP-glucose 4-epimerase